MKLLQLKSWLLLCALAVLGCGDSETAAKTAIVVIIDSDLDVDSELKSIQVGVLSTDGKPHGSPQSFELSKVKAAGKRTLPFRVRLEPANSSEDEFVLVVGGVGPDGKIVVEQRAVVQFRAKATAELNVFLGRKCVGVLCDGATTTCDRETGRCEEATPVVVGSPDANVPSEMDGSQVLVRDSGLTNDGAIPGDDARVTPQADAAADAEPGCPNGQILNTAGKCIADPCKAGSCAHGVCEGGSGVAVCNCEGSGYSGAKCETDIDECATAKCPADYPCIQTEAPGYTCRGQFADWPMPDSTPGAKTAPRYDTDTNTDAVIDLVTGLWWERTPAPAGVYAGCDGTLTTTAGATCTWDHAKAYCDGLLRAGRTDWRLPSAIELLSIIDTQGLGRATLPSQFTAAPYSAVWTASSLGGKDDSAFVLQENFGLLTPLSKLSPRAVRCVRGGAPKSIPGSHYGTQSGVAGSVEDRRTGLLWRSAPAETKLPWSQAKTHCAQLGAGWRLPTAKELVTTLDFSRELDGNGLVDGMAFPATPASKFWASNPAPSGGSQLIAVDFQLGNFAGELAETPLYVRCVQ